MKKAKKTGFILYPEAADVINTLTDAEAGKLLKAFYKYHETGEVPKLKRDLLLVFMMFKPKFDRDSEKYENICERNRQNGQNGGRKKENQPDPAGLYETQTNPVGLSENPKNPVGANQNKNYNYNYNYNYNSNSEGESNRKGEYEGENKSAPTRFQNPTIDEVKKVAEELGFTEKMAERFFYHYDANGWVQGKDKPIFNWVSALNSWAAKEHDFEKPQDSKKPYTERQYDPAALDALFE